MIIKEKSALWKKGTICSNSTLWVPFWHPFFSECDFAPILIMICDICQLSSAPKVKCKRIFKSIFLCWFFLLNKTQTNHPYRYQTYDIFITVWNMDKSKSSANKTWMQFPSAGLTVFTGHDLEQSAGLMCNLHVRHKAPPHSVHQGSFRGRIW